MVCRLGPGYPLADLALQFVCHLTRRSDGTETSGISLNFFGPVELGHAGSGRWVWIGCARQLIDCLLCEVVKMSRQLQIRAAEGKLRGPKMLGGYLVNLWGSTPKYARR